MGKELLNDSELFFTKGKRAFKCLFVKIKKIILNLREAFLKFRIVDCGSKLSCPQDKIIKKFDFKTSMRKNQRVALKF